MPAAKLITFGETTRTMTYAEGLAFVERTRRQLDRFGSALPHPEGQNVASEDADAIRVQLDGLERDFRKDLGTI